MIKIANTRQGVAFLPFMSPSSSCISYPVLGTYSILYKDPAQREYILIELKSLYNTS